MQKKNGFGVKINISMPLPDVRDCAKFFCGGKPLYFQTFHGCFVFGS
jgi:hypothetical protein